MFEIQIELFDHKFRSEYPQTKILLGNQVGYFVYKQIPFYFDYQEANQTPTSIFPSSLSTRDIFQASILLSHKHFPIFVFPPHSPAYIYIKTEKILSPDYLIEKVTKIIDGDEKIPVLYDLWKTQDFSDTMKIIEQTRNEKEYIDLFHANQIPFPDLVSHLSKSFEFSEIEPNVSSAEFFFGAIADSPRYIQIALHYLINAARLMRNFFIEDAAINLNLTREAIFTDYMKVANIHNKKTAISKLFSEELKLTEDKMDWHDELYEARNEFLAHVDNEMFTPEQNISDPDRYCYDHYEDICDLIIEYMNIRKDLVAKHG